MVGSKLPSLLVLHAPSSVTKETERVVIESHHGCRQNLGRTKWSVYRKRTSDVGEVGKKDFQYLHSTVRPCSVQCRQQALPPSLRQDGVALFVRASERSANTIYAKEHDNTTHCKEQIEKTIVTF